MLPAFYSSAAAIPAPIWAQHAPPDHPFLNQDFFIRLEQSGAASMANGWQAAHYLSPAGLVPLYKKTHSWGEYVFDQGIASAYQRLGLRYYPKWLAAIPFTPVPGARLLGNAPLLLQELTSALDCSSIHVNFIDSPPALPPRWLLRHGLQYHWHNYGYGDVADFLDQLTSRKRKNILRERASVAQSGLTIQTQSGAALAGLDWGAIYRCYLATIDKRWGNAYIPAEFFMALASSPGLVVTTAHQGAALVAMALHWQSGGQDEGQSGGALYGRWWGSLVDIPYLHFECCYYQAIEWAITHGLTRVEAGAQGEHKLARGYVPRLTNSLHYFADDRLQDAIATAFAAENDQLRHQLHDWHSWTPYRSDALALMHHQP